MLSMVLQILIALASLVLGGPSEDGYGADFLATPNGGRTHRTTMGMSVFTAHTSATTHPIIVHPRKKFSSTIAAESRLLRAKAMIDGRKYMTNQKPKNDKKNAGNRCVILPPQQQ
jgi:hypothetical protein